MRKFSALCIKAARRSRTQGRSEHEESRKSMEGSKICSGSGSEETGDTMTNQQYGLAGNIIVNSDFSEGLRFWHSNQCEAYVVEHGHEKHGRKETRRRECYVVVTKRLESWQGLEQDITNKVNPGYKYSVSAFVRVGGCVQGPADVQATLKLDSEGLPTKYVSIGRISASDENWEKLDGAFSLDSVPERVVLYFEGPSRGVDLLVHSVVVMVSDTSEQAGSKNTIIGQLASTVENIIVNHDFSGGLHSWHSNQCDAHVVTYGCAKHGRKEANRNDHYAVVTKRTENWQGLEQDITTRIYAGYKYSVSAVVKVGGHVQGSDNIQATLRLDNEGSPSDYVSVGRVSASDKQWATLHGSFSLAVVPERVIFYLEGPSPGVDLLIHSVTIVVSSSHQNEHDPEKQNINCSLDHHSAGHDTCMLYVVRQEANVGVTAGDDDNIIQNSNFEDGLNSWSGRGCKILLRESMEGGKVLPLTGKAFASATERGDSWNGIQQEITGRVQRKLAYEVTAIVRLFGNTSTADVRVTLWVQNPNGREQYIGVSKIQASDKEWVEMQGKFLLNGSPTKVMIFLEGPPPGTELLVNRMVVKHAQKLPPSSPPDFEGLSTRGVMPFRNLATNVIINHDFSEGLDAWYPNSCAGHVVSGESNFIKGVAARSGSNFAILHGRTEHWQGMEYDITKSVLPDASYVVSAWVRVSNSNDETTEVRATLKLQSENSPASFVAIGRTLATPLEWRELEGSFSLTHIPERVLFFLEGPPAGVDLLIDSVTICSHRTDTQHHPSFGENIINNSSIEDGLYGWYPLGSCTLKICAGSPCALPPAAKDSLSKHNRLSGHYIHCTSRTDSWMGPAHDIKNKLKLHITYQVSAWVRVGSGAKHPQIVNVAFDVDDRWVNGGQVYACDDRWYEVAGSFRIEKQAQKVIAYIQGPSPGVDLMVAGFQIFPVDRKRRFIHLREQTDKVRKRDVILKFPRLHSSSLSGVIVKVRQTSNSFPFGSCISRSDLDNEEFVDFFIKNFNWAVFGNELKWYHTEQQQGQLNYADADDMLDFCKRHGIQTRGHCIFWEVEDAIQSWVRSLNISDLMTAIQDHLRSLLSRTEDRLGSDIRAYMFKAARALDPSAKLFVNDYNVEDGCDAKSSPEMYIQQILDLQERGAPIDGIGLQAHINHPVGAIICSALDKLAILGLPIWFTELDVEAENEHVRAEDLEVVLREAYAHPAVEGIVLWGFWEIFMYRENAHLVNAEGDISEAGRRYLQLRQEWMTNLEGQIDENGEFVFRGFHGTYDVEILTPNGVISKKLLVEKGDSPQLFIM